MRLPMSLLLEPQTGIQSANHRRLLRSNRKATAVASSAAFPSSPPANREGHHHLNAKFKLAQLQSQLYLQPEQQQQQQPASSTMNLQHRKRHPTTYKPAASAAPGRYLLLMPTLLILITFLLFLALSSLPAQIGAAQHHVARNFPPDGGTNLDSRQFTYNLDLSSSDQQQRVASQQVPEQLAIVVSSSDNSYVSASPLSEFSPQQQQQQVSVSSSSPKQRHLRQQPQQRLARRRRPHRPHKQMTGAHQPAQVHPPSIHLQPPSSEPDEVQPTSRAGIATTATTTQRHKIGFAMDDLGDENDGDGDDDDNGDDSDDLKNQDDHDVDVNLEDNEVDLELGSNRKTGDDLDGPQIDQQRLQQSSSASQVSGSMAAQFRIRSAAIIKTRESLQLGATFINYTIVTNLNACLVECWITDSCDTAIYQESPVDFNHHLPDLSLTTSDPLRSLSSTLSLPADEAASNERMQSQQQHHNHLQQLRTLHPKRRRPTRRRRRQHQQQQQTWSHKSDFIRHNHYEHINNNYSTEDDLAAAYWHPERRSSQGGFFVCYLFECAKPSGFKCQFSTHNYYTSATRGASPGDGALYHQQPVQNEPGDIVNINLTSISTPPSEAAAAAIIVDRQPTIYRQVAALSSEQCLLEQFRCSAGNQCIASQDRCDGIVHCEDGSDEWNCQQDIDLKQQQQQQMTVDTFAKGVYGVVSSDIVNSSAAVHLLDGSSNNNNDNDYNALSGNHHLLAGGVQASTALESSADINQQHQQQFRLISSPLDQVVSSGHSMAQPHYSKIISHSSANRQPFNGRQWHDSHLASIRIGQQYENYAKGGFNSAVIAILFGIGATGMLIMIVSYKMRYIRQRLAYKGRRRSIVPDADYLINTMSI